VSSSRRPGKAEADAVLVFPPAKMPNEDTLRRDLLAAGIARTVLDDEAKTKRDQRDVA
jgi:hypothetical protein